MKTSFFLVLFFSLMVGNAHAYLDFGTGSYVLQIIAAFSIGIIFFVKNNLNRIKDFFIEKISSLKGNSKNSEEQDK